MEIFGHRLRWLDPIDAFHVAPILLVGVLLVVLFEFAAPRIGGWPALLGAAVLGATPRFFGGMHDNVKDVPETVFFALAVVALASWCERPSLARAAVAGVLAGAALAVTVNAAALPIVVIAGLWPWPQGLRRVGGHVVSRLGHYATMTALALLTFFASWPWLYRNGWRRLGKHVLAFATQGDRAPHSGWNPDPLLQAVVTMPELPLLLLIVGTAVLVARLVRGEDERGTARLLLVWMTVPVLRNSVPGAVNFDGIRHFLEFLPAAALVTAVGAASLVRRIAAPQRTAAACALTLLLVANVGTALVRYHPFEPLYFNRLVGGLRGASERFGIPEATDYWGGSYRHGLRWLGQNAERGASVYVAVFPHVVALVEGLWLRPDLRYVDSEGLAQALASAEPAYVMFVTRPEFYDEHARDCLARLTPVHEIAVDGHPVLLIYHVRPRPGSAS
jgi:hypothetical protein